MKMPTHGKPPKSALQETLHGGMVGVVRTATVSTRVRVALGRHATGRIAESFAYACDSPLKSWFVISSRSDQHLLISAVLLLSDARGARCIDITRTREFIRISYV